MKRLSDFWHRFSVADGRGVSLILDRRHPYKDDLLLLRTFLINVMLDSGEHTDVYWLCNLAEQYGKSISIMPQLEITSYMMMVHNMLKAELGLPFDYKTGPMFDMIFKAFVGLSVLSHGADLLKERGWKRIVA